ncbi:MAG: histidine--tRNA ligase [Alphaproteobacteria bacterium]|nr:histidine--tRNA ligase [Alphaproteobacteria bacterium]
MSALQPVRGTHDLLPDDFARHAHVVDTARTLAARYGFRELATPLLEFTEVFQRTLGETSDVVSKEMYAIEDRHQSGERVSLRPEYTAGICRAVMSNGLYNAGALRFFAHGPMFRYERPQKGRQRQFHQIDAEIIGVAEPQADIEVIALGWDILGALGLRDKATLEINTLGDSASRQAYRAALVEYFSARRDRLSEDSRARLERNPLRILDSKDPGDRALIEHAPLFEHHLNDAAKAFFARVRQGLDAIGVPYVVNQRLVRGLDYYTHTAFEFVTTHLGAQGALIAGGRYDGLIEAMGGRPTPGIGWAGGIERLAMLCGQAAATPRPVAVIPIGEAAELPALKLAHELRAAGITVEMGYRGNLKRRMEQANKAKAAWAVLLGESELAAGQATLRNLDSGAQEAVALSALAQRLAAPRP